MSVKKRTLAFFYIPTLIALAIGGFFLVSYPKAEIHLFINSKYSEFGDVFFHLITYMGEGWLFLAAIPMAFLVNSRAGIHIALTGLFTLLLTALFKQLLFAGEPRPIEYFKQLAELRLVPGVDINSWNSFPSGHTMAAFSIYAALATYSRNAILSFVLFLLAILVGYSRMYLSQHFLVDVEFGAILGLVSANLAFWVSKLFSSPKLDKPLLKR